MCWRRSWLFAGVGACMPWLSAGCAHVLSPEMRQQVDTTLALTQLRTAPENYTGRTVMLGGDIVSTHNLAKGTRIAVLQKPLDASGRPRDTDHTAGRFMALCEGYLDPAIYSKDRQITLAGRVLGTRSDTLGAITYVYPLLACLEVHLWASRVSVAAYPPWWYSDYWWPLYRPFWWRPHAWRPSR